MESLAAAEGLYWGIQGIEVEKVGWDLLGMREELEKYYQQLSHLSVAGPGKMGTWQQQSERT